MAGAHWTRGRPSPTSGSGAGRLPPRCGGQPRRGRDAERQSRQAAHDALRHGATALDVAEATALNAPAVESVRER
jgi:hypothetical protein